MTTIIQLPLASVLGFFLQGGFFMLLIVLLSIFALTIIIWRGYSLRYAAILPSETSRTIEALRPGSDPDTVVRAVSKDTSPLGSVIRVLLEHQKWPRVEAREAVQARARHEVAKMETGLVFLEITTGVAPLLGLLGTLSGLVGVLPTLATRVTPLWLLAEFPKRSTPPSWVWRLPPPASSLTIILFARLR